MTAKEIESRFGKPATDVLIEAIQEAAEMDVQRLDDRLMDAGLTVDATELLEAASYVGLVERAEIKRCPVRHCKRSLTEGEIAQHYCPYCETDFRATGEMPASDVIYRTRLLPTRDIAWVIVVHGMNTRGPWQEEISWRLANKLKYHAPVLIYKYGWVTLSVLFPFRHYDLARQLGRRIRSAIEHAKQNQIRQKPDLILHSFGTQLFRLLLGLPEFADINFGRVILTGCIVRPDFEWSQVITQGRVEAVFNHCGGKDIWVRAAQFCIPGTGPSGHHGFSDIMSVNVLGAEYDHGSVFTQTVLTGSLRNCGLWYRFLTLPTQQLSGLHGFRPTPWKPASVLMRGTTHALLIVIAMAILALATTVIVLGIIEIFKTVYGLLKQFG